MPSREIEKCSKKLIEFWRYLAPAFSAKYPGWRLYLSCTHRPVEEQQAFFRKGRDAAGNIVDKAAIITYVDGITRIGSHTFLPALAFDVGMLSPTGQTVWNQDLPQWRELGSFLVPGIEWGGNWTTFKDYPHFEDNDYRLKFNSGRKV